MSDLDQLCLNQVICQIENTSPYAPPGQGDGDAPGGKLVPGCANAKLIENFNFF